MAVAYPTSLLPSFKYLHNYSETPPNTIITFQPDVGPPKVRRRLTAGTRIISGQMLFKSTEVSALDTWFRNSLYDGSLTLSSVHPRSSSTTIEAYMTRPVYHQQNGGNLFMVDINLMII